MIIIKISCLKYTKDDKNFKVLKAFGVDVFELDNLEQTDNEIKKLIDKNYNTIILSNEVAGFSEDIMTKYNKLKNVNIIIARDKF